MCLPWVSGSDAADCGSFLPGECAAPVARPIPKPLCLALALVHSVSELGSLSPLDSLDGVRSSNIKVGYNLFLLSLK